MIAKKELSSIGPRNIKKVTFTGDAQRKLLCEQYERLKAVGIGLDARDIDKMFRFAMNDPILSIGMDANLTTPLTNASITTPIQFLQAWLPGFTEVVTAVRRIDMLIGIVTQGSWEDEEIVQGVLEHTGNSPIYNDYSNVPLASWNVNYERRTIIRFEEGMVVGRLEEARAAAIRTNSAENKRAASARALEIERNRVGFNGFQSGNNRTYGILNESDTPAYVDVADGASGSSEWSDKTFLEITADLRAAFSALRTQSQEQVDPMMDETTLAVANDSVDFLTTVSDFNMSVYDWMSKNYPKCRVISIPEFNNANGGDSVFYLYAETVSDSGSDDSRTYIQVVPTKFQTLGVDQRAKSYVEDYSNATAGAMLKRPYAIVRRSGI